MVENRASGACYDFHLDYENAFSWDAAREWCANYDMKHVVPESLEEDDWINNYLFGLGLFDTGSGNLEGTWVGIKGEEEEGGRGRGKQGSHKSPFSETSADSGSFMRESDGKKLGEQDVFDSRMDGLNYYGDKPDCLYMVVCDAGGDECDYHSESGKRWNNSVCDGIEGVPTRQGFGCELPIGQQMNLSNVAHRELKKVQCILSSFQS